MRRSTRARAAGIALAASTVLAGACSSSNATSDPVAAAGASVGRIHSGTLHVRVDLAAGDPARPAHVGFTADGAFDATRSGTLPVADITVHDLGTDRTTRVVSDGTHAFVVAGGTGYELTDQQAAALRTNSGSGSDGNGLGGLDLRSWVVNPTEQPATTVDGRAARRITGQVDPVAAIDGIVDLAASFGAADGSGLRVTGADADRVKAALRSSSFELLVSPDDGMLRRVSATMEFAPAVSAGPPSSLSPALVQALDRAGHVTMTIELGVDSPNGPVSVTTPARTAPIDQLPRS